MPEQHERALMPEQPKGLSLKNKLAVNPLDVGIEEKDLPPRSCGCKDEEPITQPQMQPAPVIIDPCEMLMQEVEENKKWMEEFLEMTKPKKKINKTEFFKELFSKRGIFNISL